MLSKDFWSKSKEETKASKTCMNTTFGQHGEGVSG